MVYIINYDLNKTGQNYNGLYDAIKSYGTWAHGLDSTWFIETNETSSQIFDRLAPSIDSNDYLFVTRIYGNYSVRLSQKTIDWLDARTY